MAKIIFYDLEPWEREYLTRRPDWPALGGEVVFAAGPLDDQQLPAADDAVEVVSIFVDARLTKAVFDRWPRLRLVVARSTGFDHVDLAAARERGVVVTNVPSYGENTVAEYAFALLLALSRKIYQGYDQIRETGSFKLDGLRGFDLQGKTIGVVGTGNIGRNAIRIAHGFGMRVVATDARENAELAQTLDFRYLPLEELLAVADVVTLHVPYLPATHHLINHETISKMKRGAVLVNTSRGPVVETEALVQALTSGQLAGAALDVLEEEGTTKDELRFLSAVHPSEINLRTILANHVLIDLPNVIITPHNAFNTWEALERILDTALGNIIAWRRGAPVNQVSPN